MAMTFIAQSDSLGFSLHGLASREVVSFDRRPRLSDALVKKLERKLLVVQAVLNDAEVKQFTNPYVKKWLVLLKEAVSDAENILDEVKQFTNRDVKKLLVLLKEAVSDVENVLDEVEQFTNQDVKKLLVLLKEAGCAVENILDEITTEALRHKMEAAQSQTSTSQVRNIMDMLTWNHAQFDSQSIESRVEEIIHRLEDMARDSEVLGLKGVGEKQSQRWPSTSLVDESLVYGRNGDKQKIIELLLSNNARTDAIGVISIVGTGGLGKTTLAQLLYNDRTVTQCFDLQAWVCVSKEFDPIRVTKTMLEEITLSTFKTNNLNQLQVKLKQKVNGKKFLLVLDDVWNENSSHWAMLQTPLLGGAKGSKIIVTARSTNVATAMRSIYVHCLGKLSFDDSWSLFQELAFENGESTAYPQLEAIGKKIVHKCQGLPFVIKTLGSLLYYKVEEREWDDIQNSEISELFTDLYK